MMDKAQAITSKFHILLCCKKCGRKLGPGETRYPIQEQYKKNGRWVTVGFACETCGDAMETRTRKWG